MTKRSGFTFVEVLLASALLLGALTFFGFYVRQSTQNRKYLSSFSELNTIESNLRIAMQDRAVCASMLAFDPDSNRNQEKRIVNRPSEDKNGLPEDSFKTSVESGDKLINYNSLKAGDTFLVRQDEVLSSGLAITQLRLKIHSLGDAIRNNLYLFYASLIIRGDYRATSNVDGPVKSSSAAYIPLMLITDVDGRIKECTIGKTSATQGCRVVQIPQSTNLVFASCDRDEVLMSGGASCAQPNQRLWGSFPGIANWWLYGCEDKAAGGGTVYAYCCKY